VGVADRRRAGEFRAFLREPTAKEVVAVGGLGVEVLALDVRYSRLLAVEKAEKGIVVRATGLDVADLRRA